ncbi:7SK snRNA methylphosphate capping enzyme-like isoform X2 [Polistes fuscatus]|uniref:7SK snRNA methylphosphate capping enzyme-like isoform X2 n=1 Tax=Polistes fuscatus TaxID=30207 RepID=UPI001CA908D9|nr:7SK snRNA methylphosphate capping enzyme-like isoform X2 [Polistes fuscatus]
MSTTTQEDCSAKVNQINKKDNEKSRKAFSSSHKKHKHEDSRHFKFGRKRLQSFTNNTKFFPPYKRRKKEGVIIPPTKFLLGGNICDPLNLNSMQDEEVNRAMNAVTPKSSPLPTPKHKKEVIEVLIPPNICDPLNLNNCNDNEEYEKQLISPTKKGSKRRNKKRKRASSCSGKDDTKEVQEMEMKDTEIINSVESNGSSASERIMSLSEDIVFDSPSESQVKDCKLESPQKDKGKLRLKGLEDSKDKRLRKLDVKDKIVSPVIPQPGAWKPRPQHRPSQDKKKKQQSLPNFKEKDARYQYGNYNKYYGYRNPHHVVDTRLTVFAQRKHLFFGKDILDIGCNIGHITLSIARDLLARNVTGIDIDRTLIKIARKNVKHYVNCVQSPASNEDNGEGQRDSDTNFFPMSMPINYGPIDIPGFTKNKNHRGFPYNVNFVQGNYVLEDDALLCLEQPQFDTILCLSITKWIHLNYGDAGLKRAFKRMYAQLRPGGVLVLEPQGWASYGRKKNLTERIYKNYQSIEFFPNKFTQYLLSPEVGFNKCEVVSIPPHPSKGFQRPIQLFTKVASIIETTENLETVNTSVSDQSSENTQVRNERRDQKQKDLERRQYERELFPKDKEGNMSEISQQSGESINQYDQLENVYAPSATPCYDTPGHNNDSSQSMEVSKMCYVDVSIEHHKIDVEMQDVNNKQTKESVSQTSSSLNKSNVEPTVKEIQKVVECSDNKDDPMINKKDGMKRLADDKTVIDEDSKNLKKKSRTDENINKTCKEQVNSIQSKSIIKDKHTIEKINFRSVEKINKACRPTVQSSKKSFQDLDGVQLLSNISNNEGSSEPLLSSKSDFHQDKRGVTTKDGVNDKSANDNQQIIPK